ncbi:MAG: phosphatase PAP2 family protein [Sphingomonadaceae bacterium]|nr:phosphatase PAP2 family protein [Sphingomonadaceae bacterium]
MDEPDLNPAPGRRLPFDTRLIAIFLAILAILGFAILASVVAQGGTAGFDRPIITALRTSTDLATPRGPRWLNSAMTDITALGGTTVLTVITIIVAAFLLIARRARLALLVALGVSFGAIFGTTLKALFGRARPDIVEHLVHETSLSFPSGHAMNSAVVYLTLGALLARSQQSRAARAYLMSVAALLTLTIGCSRVYLGVHWPSDVVAGWSVGAVWALLMSLLAARLQREHKIEQPTPATEPTT